MAKTRLTKEVRNTIIENVMNATNLNKMKEDILKRTSVLMRELMAAQVPPEFTAMIKGQPREWFRHAVTHYFDAEHAPETQMVAEDERHYSKNRTVCFDPIAVPTNFNPVIDETRFDGLCHEAAEWKKKRDEIEAEVSRFVWSCNTVEQLVERAPEMERHVPVKAQYGLPVVNTSNMFSALTAAGFDATLKA